MVTPTVQNLIRVLFLREQMKKLRRERRHDHHVHVIGAGAMAATSRPGANEGLRVTLSDMKRSLIAGAIKRAADSPRKIMHQRTDIRDAPPSDAGWTAKVSAMPT